MKTLLAVATIMGTVVGAGILGLPYAISESGFIPGLTLILIITFSMTLLLLYLGEVVLRCKEVYQLPGLVNKYLGSNAAKFTLILFALSIYSALISYLTGMGELMPDYKKEFMTVFAIIMSYFIHKGVHSLGKSQLILMSLKVGLILTISLTLIPSININNLTTINTGKLFYPFGVIFFALTGYSVIPELEQVLIKDKNKFKKSVIIGMTACMALYIIFSLTMIGAYNSNINQLATESLNNSLSTIGLLLVILSMTTPFIGLGVALKDMFIHDLKMSNKTAVLLTIGAPLIINLLFNPSFVEPLLISGTYSGGLTGLVIIALWLKSRKQGTIKKEYKAPLGLTGALIVTGAIIIGVVMTTLELTGII